MTRKQITPFVFVLVILTVMAGLLSARPVRSVLGPEISVEPSDVRVRVYNDTGARVEGDLVYLSTWSQTLEAYKVALADADDPTKLAQYVVTPAKLSNNAYGEVAKAFRSMATLDTSGGAVGDPVYESATAGSWTRTKPTGADQDALIVGRIAVVSATVGVVEFNVEYVPQVRGTSALAADSVTSAKIVDLTIVAADVANDTLTFAQISDSSAIDASTTFTAADAIKLTFTPSATAGDTNFLTIDANQVDDAVATDDFDAMRLDLTSESGDAGDTFDGLVIIWENGVANTIMDSAISIDNAETTASTMTDAIIVTSSGVNAGVTDGLDVSAANITNAVNIGANPILGANTDSLEISADATLTMKRNDAGAVSFLGADDAGAADTIYDTTGAGAITVGSADVTAVTVTTDGTGNAEVVLPTGSIATGEILDNTIDASDVGNSTQTATGTIAVTAVVSPIILSLTVAAGVTADVDWTLPATKIRIIDAWLVKTTAAGGGAGTVQLKTGAGVVISSTMSIDVADTTITRATTIDDASHEIAASGTLRVTRTRTASTDESCILYVKCVRVP